MGRSETCTFAVHTQVGSMEYITGAMSIKQAKGNLFSEYAFSKDNGKPLPEGAMVWPQTSAGRKLTRGHDYIHIDMEGNITYKNIE